MEPGKKPVGASKKGRFAPKPQAPRKPKVEVKSEFDEDTDSIQAKDLLRRFNDNAVNARVKLEKKVSASQIAFGHGGSSSSTKSRGNQWGASSSVKNSAVPGTINKEYEEPWDYHNSYYPQTLPLRLPHSGNPELLDEEEFGEAAESAVYDENAIRPAVELGLTEESPDVGMFLLQLPPTIPMIKRPAATDSGIASDSKKPSTVERPCSWDQLPAGFMGKMLVYKSGAVKLKLGDTIYDVSPGMNCIFAEDVVVINTAEKHCCGIGELNKHVTVSPDVDSILDSLSDM